MATRLERSYPLPRGKTIAGMADAVEAYFKKFAGMELRVDPVNAACYRIIFRTKKIHQTVRGNLKRVTGHDMNLTVSLFEQEDHVRVEFDQDIHEGVRLAKAILTAPIGLGVADLHGIYQRHNMPFELDRVIMAYLEG